MLTLSFAGHDPYQSLAPIQKCRLLTLGSRCTCSAANRPSVTSARRAADRTGRTPLRFDLRGRIDQMHALGGRRAVDRLMAFVRRNVSGPQAGGSNSGSQASALSAVSQTANRAGSGGCGNMRAASTVARNSRPLMVLGSTNESSLRTTTISICRASLSWRRCRAIRRFPLRAAVTSTICAPACAFAPIRSWRRMAARSGRPRAHGSAGLDRSPPRPAAASAACRAGSHSPRATACLGS